MRRLFSALGILCALLPVSAAFAGDITARTNLTRGTILAAHHVDASPQADLGADGQLDAVLGKELRRNMRAGTTIYPVHVQSPVAVRRNSQVKMIYRSGPIELTAQGRALDEGGVGDTISVINMESRKRVSGRILSSGDVEVGL